MIPLRDNVPTRTFPVVNYALIIANALVFFIELNLNSAGALDRFMFAHGVVPALFNSDPGSHYITLISSQFLHGGFAHLLGNMVFLYIFGDNAEDVFGHIKYLIFYIGSGIAAALTQIYFHPNSGIPMVGASGAIAGVLGAYFLFYPRARVLTLIPLGFFSRIIEVPAFLFLGIWFLMQTFSGTSALYIARASGRDVAGVAWWAHVGGFAFGFFMAILRKIL